MPVGPVVLHSGAKLELTQNTDKQTGTCVSWSMAGVCERCVSYIDCYSALVVGYWQPTPQHCLDTTALVC